MRGGRERARLRIALGLLLGLMASRVAAGMRVVVALISDAAQWLTDAAALAWRW